MNYDERMNQIQSALVYMLAEYTPPKHLTDEASQAKDIKTSAEMLNKLFPSDTNRDQLQSIMERTALRVKERHKSRTWPLPSEIATQVKRSMETNKSTNITTQDDIQTAAEHLQQTGRAHFKCNSNYIAKKLIERGLLVDERDAHWRGFDMFEDRDTYKTQRMTMDEWNNHIRIMANMWHCTEEEAERREITGENTAPKEPINKDILPKGYQTVKHTEHDAPQEEFVPW